jgi:hypothetical protein
VSYSEFETAVTFWAIGNEIFAFPNRISRSGKINAGILDQAKNVRADLGSLTRHEITSTNVCSLSDSTSDSR